VPSVLFGDKSDVCGELVNKLMRSDEVELSVVRARMDELGPPWSELQATDRDALLEEVYRKCD
jgi:hypothetical protein